MFCTENKKTRGGSQTLRSFMMELFVTMEVISCGQNSSNLDDEGIVELSLYAIIFSFHDKIGSMVEDINPEISSISLVTFFFSRCEEYNFLLPLLRNGFSLIEPFVF